MEKFVIEASRNLHGTINISGAKNAALPIIAAAILAEGSCTIHNIPPLKRYQHNERNFGAFGSAGNP